MAPDPTGPRSWRAKSREPATCGFAMLIAVVISRVRHLAGFHRWIIYLPTILPIAVTLLMWRGFYDPTFGFINVTLRS